MKPIIERRLAERCARYAYLVYSLDNGTVVVPSIAACPNRTVAAWMCHLDLGLDSKIMIDGSGRLWIKHPGDQNVTAYG